MLLWTIAEYNLIKEKIGVFGRDNCPFCEDLKTGDRVLWTCTHWAVIRNLYPYSGNEQHLMAIPIRHVPFSHELTSEETAELPSVYAFAKEFYGENAYFSCTRESMHNRSVEHLHIHFIPGQLQKEWLIKMLETQGFPASK